MPANGTRPAASGPFVPLALDDRPVFRALELACPLEGSDAAFTNLYIWQNYYRFTWARLGEALCLMAAPERGEPFCLPPLGYRASLAAWDMMAEHMRCLSLPPVFSRVPERDALLVKAARPDWEIEPDRDNDDYVYDANKLRTLSGRSMHQKKNHYNHFVQNYRAEYLPITRDLFPELRSLEDKWLTLKAEKEGAGAATHLAMEREAIHALLESFETLGQKGLAIVINGRIEAFTAGEMLTPDTLLVHVEKGNPEIRGIYVALCSHFVREVFPEAAYVNREQDLGLPGLRRSKESLKPHHFVRKYRVIPRLA
ncbi:MAG: phosphatidylglycerol lysyltransferase domain-containing protein [Deltaproteobacteria bacterium]|nr:phosphatidylglycerol lysyltransferase domain-containing protein [Deltaproteobacteria bacterium]